MHLFSTSEIGHLIHTHFLKRHLKTTDSVCHPMGTPLAACPWGGVPSEEVSQLWRTGPALTSDRHHLVFQDMNSLSHYAYMF